VATRFYTKVSGAVGVTPTTWNFAAQINPVTVPGTQAKNDGSAMTSKAEATGGTNPTARAMGRTIIGPLAGQTISGTVKAQMRGQESVATANANHAIAIKIVTPAGADRGVLLAQTASDLNSSPHEYVTALTNSKFENAAESAAIALTSQTATEGDYLVIEWGFRSATATSRTITVSYGNDSATDLPEDTTTTAANNPWFEFSGAVSLLVQGTLATILGPVTVTGAGTVSVSAATSQLLEALALSAAVTTSAVDAAALNVTLGALTATAAGAVSVSAAEASILSALTATGAATASASAASAVVLGALTVTGKAAVAVAGSVAVALGALTTGGAATVSISAAETTTLGALTVQAAATTISGGVSAALTVTLGAATLTAAGAVSVTASMVATLGALIATGAGRISVSAASSMTLGAVTLMAAGVGDGGVTAMPDVLDLMLALRRSQAIDGAIRQGWEGAAAIRRSLTLDGVR
jgi:hypothetical protein